MLLKVIFIQINYSEWLDFHYNILTIHHSDEITLGSVWVMRNFCLESCSLNRAALTNGTDCSGKPAPDCMPVVMQAMSASVYVLLITSAWLWSIVTFWQLSSRKPRRRPRTVGRALAPPLIWACNNKQLAIKWQPRKCIHVTKLNIIPSWNILIRGCCKFTSESVNKRILKIG